MWGADGGGHGTRHVMFFIFITSPPRSLSKLTPISGFGTTMIPDDSSIRDLRCLAQEASISEERDAHAALGSLSCFRPCFRVERFENLVNRQAATWRRIRHETHIVLFFSFHGVANQHLSQRLSAKVFRDCVICCYSLSTLQRVPRKIPDKRTARLAFGPSLRRKTPLGL